MRTSRPIPHFRRSLLALTLLAGLVMLAGCNDGRTTVTGLDDDTGAPVDADEQPDEDGADNSDDPDSSDSPDPDGTSGDDTDTEAGSDAGDDEPKSIPLGDPEDNPNCVDEDGDGFYAECGPGRDCHDGDAAINPDASETCNDKVDNDCSGGRDNGCSCSEDGATRPCYAGPAGTAGLGSCRTGQQTCTGGTWSDCQGATLPDGETCNGEDDDCDGEVDEEVSNGCGTCGEVDRKEMCGNGLDDNCDSRVDEGCPCGPQNQCYTGPASTVGVGACEFGNRRCTGETWSACTGDVTPKAEKCGDDIDNDCDGTTDEGCSCQEATEICDGVDNDCDGEIDEGCTPCLKKQAGNKPWQIHKGKGPTCWPKKFAKHGAKGEYQFASIPPENDAGWMPEPDNFIKFDDPSTMCGAAGQPDKCECRKGGDFTYFQTIFDIPPSFDIKTLKVTIQNVDDGARITIFNKDHPDGVVEPGSYAFINAGASSTSDLAQYLVKGKNRIVITHVDDCCKIRRIAGVHVTLNGEEITQCK